MTCPSCGLPRVVFVVFVDGAGEWSICARCVGPDLQRKPRPTVPPRESKP